nr:hypothetical protein [Tanacetum cinerariifolium]
MDTMCSIFHSLVDFDLQCSYLEKIEECECLANELFKQKENVSKEVYIELLRSFAKLEEHEISLKPALQQYQEQIINDKVRKQKESSSFRDQNEQYFKIQDLKAQLHDKNIVIRVIHGTSVSRPQLTNTQINEKVMQNSSEVKFKNTKVEDHHRISSLSNKTKYVTTCNDSLKSKTSNINVVCATCGKCVLNSNHDACVSKFLNDVNARSKKPQSVFIRPRKPIRKANQYVATPPLRKQLPQTLLSRNPRVTI